MLNYYSWWVGGGWLGQKLMLYLTLVKIEVEVGVVLGNYPYLTFTRSKGPTCMKDEGCLETEQ